MPITPNIIQTMKQTVNASVLTISTDQAFLELPSSEAMLFLQTHGMTVGLFHVLEYPPLERGDGARKTMTVRTAIVLKNYYRVKLPRA
jgi:hypothetical protein